MNRNTKHKENCQEFDIFIPANICFFSFGCLSSDLEDVTRMPNDEYPLNSLWLLCFQVGPAASLTRECSEAPLWRPLEPRGSRRTRSSCRSPLVSDVHPLWFLGTGTDVTTLWDAGHDGEA